MQTIVIDDKTNAETKENYERNANCPQYIVKTYFFGNKLSKNSKILENVFEGDHDVIVIVVGIVGVDSVCLVVIAICIEDSVCFVVDVVVITVVDVEVFVEVAVVSIVVDSATNK